MCLLVCTDWKRLIDRVASSDIVAEACQARFSNEPATRRAFSGYQETNVERHWVSEAVFRGHA